MVKKSIEGPVLRWISKKETIQVEVQLPSPPPPTVVATGANLYAGKYSFVYTSGIGAGTVGSQAYSMPFYTYTPLAAQSAVSKPQEAATSTNLPSSHPNGNLPVSSATTSTTPTSSIPHSTTPLLPPASSSNAEGTVPTAVAVSSAPSTSSWQQQPRTLSQPQPSASTQAQSSTRSQPPPILFPYPSIPTAPLIAHRAEDVCKNYVIHELSQSIPSKPPWKDTMSAMFGDHVRWDEVKVFTGKGRPLGTCFSRLPFSRLLYLYAPVLMMTHLSLG